jgi:TatA/E family protein of Tat protein translocase
MSLGPAEILVILVVALIVFGPKRLPEVGRQVGHAMRELRKMQDQVRSEIDGVIHPDVSPSDFSTSTTPALEEPDHQPYPEPTEADDGFGGPTSFT